MEEEVSQMSRESSVTSHNQCFYAHYICPRVMNANIYMNRSANPYAHFYMAVNGSRTAKEELKEEVGEASILRFT
eukprot:1394190-Amorphochlora_amoeboformis.AAC.2